MNHLPLRSGRQIAFVWRPRPAGGRGRRHGACHRAPVEAMERRVLLTGSVYDESFGNRGISRFDVFGLADAALHVLALPDGKIVVGAAALDGLSPSGQDLLVPGAIDGDPGHGVLARLNADGTLDETFSDDGITSYTFPGGAAGTTVTIEQVQSLAAQPDGKILAGVQGFVTGPSGAVEGRGVMAVARFRTDGSLDTAFGHNGLAMTNPRGDAPSTRQDVLAMTLQPDGKIVAVGSLGPPAGTTSADADPGDWGVARFNADGSVDSSFQPQVEDFPDPVAGRPSVDAARAVTVTADGRIVVGGSLYGTDGNLFGVARYNADGSKDVTFGQNGRVTTAFPAVSDPYAMGRQWSDSVLQDLVVQPDGKVVAVGSLGMNLALARYTANGTPDDSFGSHGIVATRGADEGYYTSRLTADGTLVVSGVGTRAQTQVYSATFSPAGGIVSASRGTAPLGPGVPPEVYQQYGRGWVFAATVQPDGKILGAGRVYPVADAGEGVPWEQTADALVMRIDPSDLTSVTDTAVNYAAAAGDSDSPAPVVAPIAVPPAQDYSGAGSGASSTPPAVVMAGKAIVSGGRAYSFRLSVSASASVVRQMPVTVTGPGEFSAAPQLLKVKAPRAAKLGATAVLRPTVAKYKLAAPGGSFDASENGAYGIQVQSTVAGATLRYLVGNFTVNAPVRRTGTQRTVSALRRLNSSDAVSLLDDRQGTVV